MKVTSSDKIETVFPTTPIQKITTPIERLLRMETSGGVILIIMTIAALLWANLSPESYRHFWDIPLSLSIGSWSLDSFLWPNGHHHMTLGVFINDALMTLFFFSVGLEVKGEMTYGELRDPKAASLPIIAAAGGMLFPALIYLLLCPAGTSHGWGIPTATDIAFVVGCMAILGKKVPHALRVMILTLAIADDIGAILVIAIGYPSGDGVNFLMLGYAFVFLAIINILFRAGCRNFIVHVLLGIGCWAAFVKSGVHPTISGVLLGLSIPAKSVVGSETLANYSAKIGNFLSGSKLNKEEEFELLTNLKKSARESLPLQERLYKKLGSWINFGIMPIFALANAGVEIKLGGLNVSVALAVATALVVGKPLGIFLLSFLAVKTGISRRPSGYSWAVLLGGGMLGGIGFTMALFVTNLAFVGNAGNTDSAKIGILVGSLTAAVLGTIYLSIVSKVKSDKK